ncbi:hypothetical protein E4Z66_05650 [Aliishimia ponticola]|uniref:Uncharacterized protein n=1 Tax=Aliishimia ponticola TaxID=2499833 RepID=A0A4S4NH90_9RHOB|nr:hypothetical protein [Aliishimia ponticola]THH39042.1 hypothetical protein E4Z66_05650 [Aliishimia ponticola]
MGKNGAISALAALIIGQFPGPSFAVPADPDPLYAGIATCLGRFSAEIEHARLRPGPAEVIAQRYSSFDELYTAIGPDRRYLSLRIAAKMQHRQLLDTALFGTDPRRARLAGQRAARQIASCAEMLLS